MTTRRNAGLSLVALLAVGCAEKQETARAVDAADSQASAPTPAPAPQTITFPPTPQDSAVSWTELTRIIRAHPDSVRAVMQTHARKVSATFLDGHRLHTTEPSIDGIVSLLRQVDPAGHILIATE